MTMNIHNKRTTISDDDIIAFETTYDQSQERALFALYTGWSQYWNNPKQQRNTHAFSRIPESVVTFLLKRHGAGIAIDTLKHDGLDSRFPVYKIL